MMTVEELNKQDRMIAWVAAGLSMAAILGFIVLLVTSTEPRCVEYVPAPGVREPCDYKTHTPMIIPGVGLLCVCDQHLEDIRDVAIWGTPQ